jgi:hypothetical protein
VWLGRNLRGFYLHFQDIPPSDLQLLCAFDSTNIKNSSNRKAEGNLTTPNLKMTYFPLKVGKIVTKIYGITFQMAINVSLSICPLLGRYVRIHAK